MGCQTGRHTGRAPCRSRLGSEFVVYHGSTLQARPHDSGGFTGERSRTPVESPAVSFPFLRYCRILSPIAAAVRRVFV